MTEPAAPGIHSRRALSLTALLGERIKSRLPGYSVALVQHPAAPSTPQHPRSAVVVSLDPGRLEVVAWMETNSSDTADWVDYLAEVRVVLRSSDCDGVIVDMFGASLELDEDEVSAEEVLTLASDLLEEELRASLGDLEPSVAFGARLALRIYDNDPFG